ncbi:MAG: ATP-binding cassette domain-containing protein [Deltaproteobacteria bacterium]|nr:ATP-binding cassette domain-containing protein [Deltaproteobacteria bacterium]
MIEAKELSKTYDDVEALRKVSFKIKSGEVIGLLGPNGAGKTTLMKILTGFIHPSSGTALIGGMDVLKETAKVQEIIGYLPENSPVYPELTVQSYLKMIAELRNIPPAEQRGYISEAVYAAGLADRLTTPIGSLSKGYRQRVGLAQAILHKPKLLILDEPTNGLDPTQIIEVRRLIKKLSQKSTILLSTHILSEVEATCSRAIIIIRGELKADALLSEMESTNQARISFTNSDQQTSIIRQLQGLPGVKHVEIVADPRNPLALSVQSQADDICPQIFTLAKDNDWPLCELRRETRTLEAVFNELIAADGGVR